MSAVIITITPPGGSPQDITNAVIFDRSFFESNFNAVPGTFDILVRDPDRTLSFETGAEILLEIDGLPYFGGYVLQVGMTHLAPAADTEDLDTYYLRAWHLTGSDYNIILDKRVWRNTSDYLHSINLTATTDGAQIIEAITNYADMSDFSTAGVDSDASTTVSQRLQQGNTLRRDIEIFSFFGGCVYYVDASKTIVYIPFEQVEKRWGFSDQPNEQPITVSPAEYQGATYGFRQVEGTEDGTYIVNDALIWGGSPFAGTGGGTVFSRVENTASQTAHGRWQHAETHFGERLFAQQAQTDARANVIVNGPPGADVFGQQKGLRYPQWQFTFTWFSADVPVLSGQRDHIVAGELVTIDMNVFGTSQLLPVRSVRTSFPDAFEDDGSHLVQFEGTFGLQVSDPFTLWRYIIANQNDTTVSVTPVVTNGSGGSPFGASFSGTPQETPDGSRVVFSIEVPYISGSLIVYLNGLGQRPGVDYSETSGTAGTFTFSTAPLSTDTIQVNCYTLAS